MRGAIYRHFEKTLERFGGRPVLRFDCPDDPALALSGPEYEFQVREVRGGPLGVMYLEVAVLDAGGISQHVSVKVRVLLRRAVVTAQRAVDAGAVISGQDIVMREMTFDRLVGTGIRPGSAGCRAAGEAVHSGRHVAPGGSARAGFRWSSEARW
jgi:hypothetical protein